VGGDVSIDSESLLVTDFMNLKIKLVQSFKGAHRDKMCVHIFIRVNARKYVCTVFLKKTNLLVFCWEVPSGSRGPWLFVAMPVGRTELIRAAEIRPILPKLCIMGRRHFSFFSF
jgi:hypothetical protein